MGRNINQISSRHSWLCVRSKLNLSERREVILACSQGPQLCYIMARKSPISSHEWLRIKRKGEPWHTGPKSFPNYFYIDKETFRMVWLTSWVRKNVGWWERFCASVRDSDELQHSRPYRGASSASLYLTKCQERCFKTSWSTFVEKRMSVMIFKGQSCYLWRWGAVLLWRRPPGRHIYSENSGRCKEVVPEFVSGWDMKITLK
mgnify:FL=1